MSGVRCNDCGAEFSSDMTHDCRVTRREFEAFRRDLAEIARGLCQLEAHKNGKPIWDATDLLRIANIPYRGVE